MIKITRFNHPISAPRFQGHLPKLYELGLPIFDRPTNLLDEDKGHYIKNWIDPQNPHRGYKEDAVFAYLTREKRPHNILVVGDPCSGKSTFIEKIRYDLFNRHPWEKKPTIYDLLSVDGWERLAEIPHIAKSSPRVFIIIKELQSICNLDANQDFFNFSASGKTNAGLSVHEKMTLLQKALEQPNVVMIAEIEPSFIEKTDGHLKVGDLSLQAWLQKTSPSAFQVRFKRVSDVQKKIKMVINTLASVGFYGLTENHQKRLAQCPEFVNDDNFRSFISEVHDVFQKIRPADKKDDENDPEEIPSQVFDTVIESYEKQATKKAS